MRFAILILVILTSVACSKKDAATSEPEAPTGDTAPAPEDQEAAASAPSTGDSSANGAEAPAADGDALPKELQADPPALSAAPTVTVLDSGQEPRRALSLNLKAGSSHSTEVVVGYGVDAVIAMLGVSDPVYNTTYSLDLKVGDVAEDGTAKVTFEVKKAHFDPTSLHSAKLTKQAKSGAAAMKGVTGSYALSPNGAVADLKLERPAHWEKKTKGVPGGLQTANDNLDNLHWALTQLTPICPKEPVGVGAKWTVHHTVEQADLLVNELRTYEVTKIDGPAVELEIIAQQTAKPQDFQNSIGRDMALLSLNGDGNGTEKWTADALFPSTAIVRSEAIKGVRQHVGQAKQQVDAAVRTSRTATVGKP